MNNILEIKDLCKSYDSFKLDNVSFSLPRGYIMGFIGQNGSGKTTTIRTILNMAFIDSGTITVSGLDSVRDANKISQKIGVVFDSTYFALHLKAGDIERQLKPFYDSWDTAKFYSYLTKFSLPTNKPISEFSKGMKMKFMAAIALSHDAELIILDEPTSGLDPVARDELLEILLDYVSDENHSVLFSTHITQDVERIADYVTVLDSGKVWYTGTKDELMNDFVILRLGNNEITDEIAQKSLNIVRHETHCDALIRQKDIPIKSGNFVYEKASLDEMLVLIARKGEKR